MNLDFSQYVEKYSYERIQQHINVIADQIKNDYFNLPNNTPIVFTCILNGAFKFFSDLLNRLDSKLIYVDFIQLSSYHGNAKSSGTVKLIKDFSLEKSFLNNSHIIIVEDIIDTGTSLNWLMQYLKTTYDPKSLKIATLFSKPYYRKYDVPIDYIGFIDTSNDFLVGYGFDDNEQYRNLNSVYKKIS